MRKPTLLLIPVLLWLLPVGCNSYDPETSSRKQQTLRETADKEVKTHNLEDSFTSQKTAGDKRKQHGQQDENKQEQIKQMLVQQGVSSEHLEVFMASQNLDWEYVISSYSKKGEAYIESLKKEINAWLQTQNQGTDSKDSANERIRITSNGRVTTGRQTYTLEERRTRKWNELLKEPKKFAATKLEELSKKNGEMHLKVPKDPEKPEGPKKKKMRSEEGLQKWKKEMAEIEQHIYKREICPICSGNLGAERSNGESAMSGIFTWPCSYKHQYCIACIEKRMKRCEEQNIAMQCLLCGHEVPDE